VRVLPDEPSWWYSDPPSALAVCLQPVGALYGWVSKARFARVEPYRSRLPVVCVGNLTAGGTGKTPLTIYLCEHCKVAGHEPVVLTRGYGGRIAGPYWVNAKLDTASAVGDEALLLARTAPTHVARNRPAGARAIESGPHPVTLIVMDDGLQNPGLVKDLTLAVVDGWRGLGNGRVIPAGPLRAPLDFQLDLTDAVIVNEPAGSEETEITAWLRRRFAGPVLRASVVPAGDPSWLTDARVVAWAGIGAPQRFFSLLARLGAQLAKTVAFRDHQPVAEKDARALLEAARQLDAMLVTTEKDLARLTGAAGLPRELASACRVLPVKLQFAEADAERLSVLLDAALAQRR
jgi:tetraacyldisaccharide 4'-kinase